MKVVGGHWVTINGVHVFINDKTGRVTKGPKNLVGYTAKGVEKKLSDTSSKPRKKKHEGRKTADQKTLESVGYTEKQAKKIAKKANKPFKPVTSRSKALESMKETEYRMVRQQKRDPVEYVNTRNAQIHRSQRDRVMSRAISQKTGNMSFDTAITTTKKTTTNKPKFYNKKNFRQAYSEADLNKNFTSWDKLSTPKKSGKVTNPFLKK